MDTDRLTERQGEIVRIVEAIDGVLKSRDWHILKGEFEQRAETLERQLLTEAKKSKVEEDKIYFLQGQIAEAKRFDLPSWADKLKKELTGIKIHLQ